MPNMLSWYEMMKKRKPLGVCSVRKPQAALLPMTKSPTVHCRADPSSEETVSGRVVGVLLSVPLPWVP